MTKHCMCFPLSSCHLVRSALRKYMFTVYMFNCGACCENFKIHTSSVLLVLYMFLLVLRWVYIPWSQKIIIGRSDLFGKCTRSTVVNSSDFIVYKKIESSNAQMNKICYKSVYFVRVEGFYLSPPTLFVNSMLKSIWLISNDQSEQLKFIYFTSDMSTWKKK